MLQVSQYVGNCLIHVRIVPSDLRRASRRFFSSISFDTRIDLTAGMNADYTMLVIRLLNCAQVEHTLRLFPLLSLSADGFSSSAPSPLGPMLLLRVFFFFGEDAGGCRGALKDTSPSAMFSLASSFAIVACVCGVGVR